MDLIKAFNCVNAKFNLLFTPKFLEKYVNVLHKDKKNSIIIEQKQAWRDWAN